MLDIAVPEKGLQRSRVVAAVCERVAAGVPQHVRVGLEAKTCLDPSTLDHAGEPIGAKGCPTLRCEHEG